MGKENDRPAPITSQIVSSMEATLAQGRANADERARGYLEERKTAKAFLDEARTLLSQRLLSPAAFSSIEQDYQRLVAFPDENPILKSALERILGEPSRIVQASQQKKEKASVQPDSLQERVLKLLEEATPEDPLTYEKAKKTGINKNQVRSTLGHLRVAHKMEVVNLGRPKSRDVRYVLKSRAEVKIEGESRTVTEKKTSSRKLIVPKGMKAPKLKELFVELNHTSINNPVTYPELCRKLWRGVKNELRRGRLEKLMVRARRVALKTGFEIVDINPRGSSKGSLIYVKRQGEEVAVSPKEAQTPVATQKTETLKILRGETVELPDRQMVTMGKIEKTALEGLLSSSLERPVSYPELSKFVYGDDKPESIHKLSKLLAHVKKKLANTNWKIIDLTSAPERLKGKGSQLFLGPKDFRAEAQEKVPVQAEKTLPEYPSFQGQTKKIFDLLVSATAENPVKRSAIISQTLNEGADVTAYIVQLRKSFLPRIRESLKKHRKEIAVVYDENKEVSYYLVELGQAPKIEKSKVEKAKSQRPKAAKEKVKKDRLVETVELSEGINVIVGKMQAKLLTSLLGATSEKPVEISYLAEILYGNPTRENIDLVGSIITSLKYKITEAGFSIINANIGKKNIGQRAAYYLEKTGEPAERVELKRFEEEHEFILPNGVKITGKNAKILKILNEASQEKPITSVKLAEEMYPGISYPRAKLNLMPSLTGIRHSLENSGLELVVKTDKETRIASYYLRRAQENVVFDARTQTETKPSAARLPRNSEVKVESVPYRPTKEEMRSEEETRIVDKIIFSLLEGGGKIYFEKLQKYLETDERIEIVGGQRYYRIYEAKELIAKFFFGLNKLREENEIEMLREAWTENDRRTWENEQQLVRRLSSGDFHDFQKKVRDAIDRAEKDFYKRFPPEQGLRQGLIKIDK